MKEPDRIQIEGLELSARIGVPEEERGAPQRLVFNLTLWPIRPLTDLGDDIERAVNYATVCAVLKSVVASRTDRLIETLANAVALHLLDQFAIQKITVELRKYILPDVEFVAVIVTRERELT